MKEEKLKAAFSEIFPEDRNENISIVESTNIKGNKFHYAQTKENKLKVFHDRVEAWEKNDTKNPVKTLELKRDTIQALNKLYNEEDSIF